MLLVVVGYDKSAKKHECIIEEWMKGQRNFYDCKMRFTTVEEYAIIIKKY